MGSGDRATRPTTMAPTTGSRLWVRRRRGIVAVVIRIVVGLLLVAHGLVHLIFMADDVAEFTFEGSWVVPDSAERTVGVVLMATAVGLFGLAGLALWGVPGVAGLWPELAISGAVVSLLLLVVFWDTRMIYGTAINLGLIVVAVVQPGLAERM
jgi:hypothetical protein